MVESMVSWFVMFENVHKKLFLLTNVPGFSKVLWVWCVEFRAAVAHHDHGLGRCHWKQVEKPLVGGEEVVIIL